MDSGLHSARPSTPRSRARNGNASSARLGQDGLAEVRETYRRVMEVTVKKPSKNSMSAPPKSLGLAQQLSANRQRRREISDQVTIRHIARVASDDKRDPHGMSGSRYLAARFHQQATASNRRREIVASKKLSFHNHFMDL